MKIRIKGNSVRLRLTRSEVATLYREGNVEESTVFAPEAQLHYKLAVARQAEDLKALLSGSSIIISIKDELARDWADNNMVGFKAWQDNGAGERLFLLVEKDFQCLDETSEDQSDNYPNPLAGGNQ